MDIVIKVYFSGKLKKEDIHHFVNYVNNKSLEIYNKDFEEMSFSFYIGNKKKRKNLKYNLKNINKFNDLVTDEQLSGFGIFNLIENWKYKINDHYASLDYFAEDKYIDHSSLMLKFSLENTSKMFTSDSIKEILDGLLSYLIDKSFDIKYGFVFSMEREKNPGLFASGIGNENLTKEETVKAYKWTNNQRFCDVKLWDIFWGNIITPNHFNNGFSENQLIELFGEKNVKKDDKNQFYICYLPYDITLSNEIENKNKNLREEIRSKINDYQMII